jgi:hypothetical protein
MQLVNGTGAVAYLQVVDLGEPERRAAVIVKRTYVVGSDGALAVDPEPMPLVPDQLVTEFGHFHGEVFFRKRGADICVLGTVRLAAAVREARLRLEVGAWSHELRVVGDRFWTRGAGAALVPSAPAPFAEMPVSYARAFGGTAEVNGEDVPWPDNPMGRGYYESEEQAFERPLPNVESATGPTDARWEARPPVAGWGPYPMYWGLRARAAVKGDDQTGELLDVTPELFNHAHPQLILERVERGTPVRLLGLRPEALRFAVPREVPRVRARVGNSEIDAFGDVDGVFYWADAGRVVVTWRARFRYPVRPEEIRRADLTFVE